MTTIIHIKRDRDMTFCGRAHGRTQGRMTVAPDGDEATDTQRTYEAHGRCARVCTQCQSGWWNWSRWLRWRG